VPGTGVGKFSHHADDSLCDAEEHGIAGIADGDGIFALTTCGGVGAENDFRFELRALGQSREESSFAARERVLQGRVAGSATPFFAGGGWFVAFAGENRQAGVFGEFRLREGTLAEEETRAFGGLDGASVEAIGAETDRSIDRILPCGISHVERIA
jgi:hypothetical protein